MKYQRDLKTILNPWSNKLEKMHIIRQKNLIKYTEFRTAIFLREVNIRYDNLMKIIKNYFKIEIYLHFVLVGFEE